jgi:acyl-CoA-binding protein
MSISDEFAAAQVRIKELRRAPGTDELLQLYSLYKQGTLGPAQGKRPEALDFKARAKYDAWAARGAMSRDQAMTAYVALVETLTRKYG